jgi:hypothetical protein
MIFIFKIILLHFDFFKNHVIKLNRNVHNNNDNKTTTKEIVTITIIIIIITYLIKF